MENESSLSVPLQLPEASPIDGMIKIYQDLGRLNWGIAAGRVMYGQVAERSDRYYDQLTQYDRDLTDDEFRRFGVLKFQEANVRSRLKEAESSLYDKHHELFEFVRENLFGRLVQVKTVDDNARVDVIGMSRKGSYYPERVKKGERKQVRGRVMLPPSYPDSVEMRLSPTRKSRFFRNIDDYLVPVVTSFGENVLIDIELID